MKSDFLIAITQLAAEKNLPREVVIAAIEAALVSAYRRNSFAANQNILVKIDPVGGKVKVWAEKTVVEQPSDNRREVSLDDARQVKSDIQLGEVINMEATPRDAGRIAAQTAKQVILQRLHEAEHSAIFEEYVGKEGDIVTGLVQHIEPHQMLIDLGRAEAVLPAAEQVRNERYRIGQRLRAYLLEVVRTNRGPLVVLSRSHPNLLRRLFELEVPEVFNGIVELKAVAREAGYRSKVAVAARQDGIDPVGCCVGLRGIRIQNIINELNGEKIDIVTWSPDTSVFIANALSPAQVSSVKLDGKEGIATVVVPDRQLSLAIGKEGQNARLAAKLTGWRIDIKSASAAEAERVTKAEPLTEVEEEEIPAEIPAIIEPALLSVEAVVDEVAEPLPPVEAEFTPPVVPFEPEVAVSKSELRFAEDIVVPRPIKPGAKSSKKKKATRGKESDEDGARLKKRQTRQEILDDEEF